MKKLFFLLLSIAASMAIGLFAIAIDMSDRAVICVSLCACITISALLGWFDEPAKQRGMRHTSIKDASRLTKAA